MKIKFRKKVADTSFKLYKSVGGRQYMVHKPVCFLSIYTHFDDDDDELFFAEWLTNERRLALFPAKTIVRDSNHHKSTRRE